MTLMGSGTSRRAVMTMAHTDAGSGTSGESQSTGLVVHQHVTDTVRSLRLISSTHKG